MTNKLQTITMKDRKALLIIYRGEKIMKTNSKYNVLLLHENIDYNAVPFVISFSALFPESVLKAFNKHAESPFTDIRNFLTYLLPASCRLIDEKKELAAYDDHVLACFWNGNIENVPMIDFLYHSILQNIISMQTKPSNDSRALVDEIQEKLEPLIKNLPAGIRQKYSQDIYQLCNEIVHHRNNFSGLSSIDLCRTFPILKTIKTKTLLTTLAYLALLASTSSIWCKPEKKKKVSSENAAKKILPYYQSNFIQITYHDGMAAVPRICWAALFPESFLTKVQQSLQKDSPFYSREWFQLFIPDEFQTKNGKHFFITNRSESSFSNYWGGKSEGNACCKLLKENIVQEGKKLSNSYRKLLKHIYERCTYILSNLPQEVLIDYQKDISYLYNQLQEHAQELLKVDKLILQPVVNNMGDEIISDLSLKLLYLILIASTWTIWADSKNNKDAKNLASILFAPSDEKDTEEIRIQLIKQSNLNAAQKLEDAKEAFYSQKFKKCGNLCREIISNNLADDSILGDAYYYLVRCHDDFGYRYDGYYNREEFQYRALDYGSKEALGRWSVRRLNSLLYLPKSDKKAEFSIVSNVSNKEYRMNIFLRSYIDKSANKDTYVYVKNTSDFPTYIQPNAVVRFLLISDDFDKNYIDLLYILDTIKNWNNKNEMNQFFTNQAWENYKIYVRLNETKYASLLDTALKHMDGITLPVVLIDDNKLAAQYLLSHYPLFYPIRNFSTEDLCSTKDITINLNIISESNNELTSWIIREAYWLGCFYYTGITLSINIISPETQSILSQLEFSCPGLFMPIPDSEKVSKIKWNDECKIKQLESNELFEYLWSLQKTRNSYSYYIINCDTDIASLHLATKIREWEIRNAVHSDTPIKTANFPIITYHCENMDISHMAESMVVHQEEYGDNWYNNYSIIPFSSNYFYQMSEIDGGYFEQLSQSVHLQYCGCKTNASKEEKAGFLKDYFTRCYNRDSSMAVALSIPYRLFQMKTNDKDHILPVGWVFKNTEAFSDPISLRTMAEQAKNFINKAEMLNYERGRWMRYMISRGWQKATADETIKFMKAGNPRRQLYIGLLHGCICSSKELEQLQEELYREYKYGSNNDHRFAGNEPRTVIENNTTKQKFDKFFQYDKSSLEQTADIIQTLWLTEKETDKVHAPAQITR